VATSANVVFAAYGKEIALHCSADSYPDGLGAWLEEFCRDEAGLCDGDLEATVSQAIVFLNNKFGMVPPEVSLDLEARWGDATYGLTVDENFDWIFFRYPDRWGAGPLPHPNPDARAHPDHGVPVEPISDEVRAISGASRVESDTHAGQFKSDGEVKSRFFGDLLLDMQKDLVPAARPVMNILYDGTIELALAHGVDYLFEIDCGTVSLRESLIAELAGDTHSPYAPAAPPIVEIAGALQDAVAAGALARPGVSAGATAWVAPLNLADDSGARAVHALAQAAVKAGLRFLVRKSDEPGILETDPAKPLYGKSYVLTGKFAGTTKQQVRETLIAKGATVEDRLHADPFRTPVTALIVGASSSPPSATMKRAQALGVIVHSWTSFKFMLDSPAFSPSLHQTMRGWVANKLAVEIREGRPVRARLLWVDGDGEHEQTLLTPFAHDWPVVTAAVDALRADGVAVGDGARALDHAGRPFDPDVDNESWYTGRAPAEPNERKTDA
jgi:hypothetical protein